MASLMENLIEILDQESGEYEALLGLSRKKTPVIVSGNLEELTRITDEEQTIAGRVNKLDHKRQEIYADIANVINKDVKTLKLTDLIAMLEKRPSEQQKLAQTYDRLRAVVQEVKRVNEQNRILLQNALEMIEFDMNMLQSRNAAPEGANYNRGAYNTGEQLGVNFGGFDAKQ
mgnify:FL=1